MGCTVPIISHKKKYIYIYIPKVACTTIREMLAKADGIRYYPNWTCKNGKQFVTKFNRIKLNKIFKNDYYIFSFVRNPWDRLVSCYFDKVFGVRKLPNSPWVYNGTYRNFANKYRKNFRNMSFTKFVEFVYNVPDSKADGHFTSQFYCLGKYLQNIDFIGQFENLNKDLEKVKKILGISKQHKHLWKGKRKQDYRKYYTKKTIDLVAKRYNKDIEVFKYKF